MTTEGHTPLSEKCSADAPVEYDSGEAMAWADGYNTAVNERATLLARVEKLEADLAAAESALAAERERNSLAPASEAQRLGLYDTTPPAKD